MAKLVVMGAMCQCTMGTGPCSLLVIPSAMVDGAKKPAATIMDKEVANLPSFIMCQAPANPTVASATAAAMGVLTPMPCVPVIPAPWSPGAPKTMIGNKPALSSDSTCMCAYTGTISIKDPGQQTIDVA